MGLGGISPGSLLLIFFIVLILFGTKKLRSVGEDLGHALRGFKKAFNQDEELWHHHPKSQTAHEKNLSNNTEHQPQDLKSTTPAPGIATEKTTITP